MEGPEVNFQIKGWMVIPFSILFSLFMGYRIHSMNNMENNDELVAKVKHELLYEYYRDQLDAVKGAMSEGDRQAVDEGTASLISAKVEIEKMKVSYSVFDYSTSKKDVVVKAVYSLEDKSGVIHAGTRYLWFEYTPAFNQWYHRGERSALSYYLGFL